MSSVQIYFSDFFAISPRLLEEYGAFDVSLINDLPLFVDPFLLFDSDDPQYRQLHDDIVRYVKYLRDVTLAGSLSSGTVADLFRFPEVRQNWLGFSRTGNRGSGLGKDFADALVKNLTTAFRDFGSELVTRGSHLEKLCLVGDGVGKDHLSDFVTNLIKKFLLEYTQTFARQCLDPAACQTFAIRKVEFDYHARRWKDGKYLLPAIAGDFVLLTPKDILTKDEAWINRSELLDRFQDVYAAVPDEQLRSRINEHFSHLLTEDAGREELRKAAAHTIERFPQVLDYFIKDKEDHADEAHRVSKAKVRQTETQFVEQIRSLVDSQLAGTEFYRLGDSFDESLRRVHFLKDVIENKDGYRLFYLDGKPLQREADLQIMYRLCWYATPFDVNREVNNGRGPVDFKVSIGSVDKTLVEFKLASNSKLKQNLAHQVGVYEAANYTRRSIKAILYFSESQERRLFNVLNDMGLAGCADIVVIDARNDNKPSASNVQ